MATPSRDRIEDRLRAGLAAAMKARDRVAISALRSAIAAIDNAQAVDPHQGRGVALGVGARDVPRRQFSQREVAEVVGGEIRERNAAADEYEGRGRPDEAATLRAEAAVLGAYLVSDGTERLT